MLRGAHRGVRDCPPSNWITGKAELHACAGAAGTGLAKPSERRGLRSAEA